MAAIKKCIVFGLVTALYLIPVMASAQAFISIWPKGNVPNSKHLKLKDSIANERVYRVMDPGMYGFFPGTQENKGAAVVICPGGGYDHLAYVISGLTPWALPLLC
jgi:hypothetical protein